MRIQVKSPELSESVQGGTLLEWRRQVGDSVAQSEILADLETDKVILEVPARDGRGFGCGCAASSIGQSTRIATANSFNPAYCAVSRGRCDGATRFGPEIGSG
jgi:hypothetical protein